MTDLKPCPFCGADADRRPIAGAFDRHGNGYEWRLDCSMCGAGVDLLFATPAEAISAWNRRAPAVGSEGEGRRFVAQALRNAAEFGKGTDNSVHRWWLRDKAEEIENG